MASTIYTGLWTNWSKGRVLGATLTLNQRDSGLLTAFIATFVTVVGAQSWKIVSYICHQLNSTAKAHDGLHHQRQIILRNSTTATTATWTFLQQAWAWKGRTKRSLARTLPWALLGAVYVIAFALLAVFSSQISASTGTTRLVEGAGCAAWYYANITGDTDTINRKSSNDSLRAQTYARACYDTYDSLSCTQLVQSSINTTSRTNITCPWPGMCLEGDTSAFQIESALINSHTDLGINAPVEERVDLQLRTTCAPIRLDDFVNTTSGAYAKQLTGSPDNQIERFWLGPVNTANEELGTSHTFIYNVNSSTGHLYDISPRQNHADDPTGKVGWQPIPEMSASNADVAIVFINSNSVVYAQPVDDPVFAAHGFVKASNKHAARYESDDWTTAIACIEQYRFCKPGRGSSTCTDWLGEFQVNTAFERLNPSEAQVRTMNRLWDTLYMTIYDYVRARNTQALLASDTLVNYLSPGLPVNQWMLEVQGWFHVNLANIQHAAVEWATGPSDPVLLQKILDARVNNTVEDKMCRNQMVRKTAGTTSFSVLGMVVLFVLGGFIVILSFVIDSVGGWIQQRTGKGLIARLEWIGDDKMQLHRLLSNELGLGSWEEGEQAMPVMSKDAAQEARYRSLAANVVLEQARHGPVVYETVNQPLYKDGSGGTYA